MSALILVDLQNDFLPGGALPVNDGDSVIPLANRLLNHPFTVKVASKDWHPYDHGSFAINHDKQPGDNTILGGIEQVLWPVHCVQGTQGAEFAKDLEHEKIEKVFFKGTDKEIDSYSTFFDNNFLRSTGLDKYLHEKNIKKVYIAGLATDYCVLYSVLDATQLGFETYVIVDACKGIDLKPGNVVKSLEAMHLSGAHLITLDEALKHVI